MKGRESKRERQGRATASESLPKTVQPSSQRLLIASALLGLLVLAVFGRTIGYGFVNYDDSFYVYENAAVTQGLTLDGIARMFTAPQHHDWVPLTALSHALDWQLYGSWAGGHHLSNVLLHALSSILLLQVLWRMTGLFWRSCMVAALFAIHPLHVESVAWISERKDVLSGLFFMLVLAAYERYARQGTPLRYAWVLLFLILGLMSKAMLITLPFLLLILDVWPLRRLEQHSFKRLVLEKLPLLLPCLIVTWIGMRINGPAAVLSERFSLALRVQNALVSSVDYLRQMLCPVDLAVLYPYPIHGISTAMVLASTLLLLAITAVAFFYRRKQPWLLAGWCWYLGMLVPVSGLIPPGEFAKADRYTYLPQIGLYIAIVWMLSHVLSSHQAGRKVLATLAALSLSGSAVLAWHQCGHWQNSNTLWQHTLASTGPNANAHYNLGLALKVDGRKDEAIQHYREALQIQPHHVGARYSLGNLLLEKGLMAEAAEHLDQVLQVEPNHPRAHADLGVAQAAQGQVLPAMEHFQTALNLDPGLADAHSNLGNALLQQGRLEEAVTHYLAALKINPRHADAHYNLGTVLSQQNKTDEAIEHYQKAIETAPGMVQAHNNLAIALTQKGRVEEAASHYEAALKIRPDSMDTCNNLAWLLAASPNEKLRNGTRALELALKAATLTQNNHPLILHTLAAAYAANARFAEAQETAGRAINLATSQGNQPLVTLLQSELASYQNGQPLRDPSLR